MSRVRKIVHFFNVQISAKFLKKKRVYVSDVSKMTEDLKNQLKKKERQQKCTICYFLLRKQGNLFSPVFKVSYKAAQQMALQFCFIVVEFYYQKHSLVGTRYLHILSPDCANLLLQLVAILKTLFYSFLARSAFC